MSRPARLALAGLAARLATPSAALAHASRCTAPAAADSTPAQLWALGMTFDAFHAGMSSRKAEWDTRIGWVAIPDAAAERMRAIRTPLRVLVVAEEGCGDSMNSLPYLVRLVALAPDIQLRVVNSTVGRSIMEAHRTPDGRAATPTVVVLDARDQVVACWIERPSALLAWSRTPKDSLPKEQRFGSRMAWYENDKGRSALAEWVPMLEAAAAGRGACAG